MHWDEQLKQKRARGEMLVGAAIGCGFAAKAMDGAEFLLVSQEAEVQMDGHPELLARLGYGGNCNLAVEALRRRIPQKGLLSPLFAAVGAAEPFDAPERLAAMQMKRGFFGIANRPTTGGWVGSFGEGIEAMGVGFSRECALIRWCTEQKIPTVGFATDEKEVLQMAAAGPDVLILRIRRTADETYGWSDAGMEAEAKQEAADIIRRLRLEFPAQIVLCSGGDTPERGAAGAAAAGADGYFLEAELQAAALTKAIRLAIEREMKAFEGKGRINCRVETALGLFTQAAEPYIGQILATPEAMLLADGWPEAATGVDRMKLAQEAARHAASGAPGLPVWMLAEERPYAMHESHADGAVVDLRKGREAVRPGAAVFVDSAETAAEAAAGGAGYLIADAEQIGPLRAAGGTYPVVQYLRAGQHAEAEADGVVLSQGWLNACAGEAYGTMLRQIRAAFKKRGEQG